jgi:hypothetical protein
MATTRGALSSPDLQDTDGVDTPEEEHQLVHQGLQGTKDGSYSDSMDSGGRGEGIGYNIGQSRTAQNILPRVLEDRYQELRKDVSLRNQKKKDVNVIP